MAISQDHPAKEALDGLRVYVFESKLLQGGVCIMQKRTRSMVRRSDPEFMEFFKKHATVDSTGKISVQNCYANAGFNIAFKNCPVNVTYANAVWFLTHGKWPRDGYHIDHIDDDALNNRPDNLQEITEAENQIKRRGRKVYRSYGKGQYGFGMSVHHDKRDGYYYVGRNVSRGFGKGDLKGVKYSIGRFESLEEAKVAVAKHIRLIKFRGLDYIPSKPAKKPKKVTLKVDSLAHEMRKMRAQGFSLDAVAGKFGLKPGAVYKRIRDIPVDCRVAKRAP